MRWIRLLPNFFNQKIHVTIKSSPSEWHAQKNWKRIKAFKMEWHARDVGVNLHSRKYCGRITLIQAWAQLCKARSYSRFDQSSQGWFTLRGRGWIWCVRWPSEELKPQSIFSSLNVSLWRRVSFEIFGFCPSIFTCTKPLIFSWDEIIKITFTRKILFHWGSICQLFSEFIPLNIPVFLGSTYRVAFKRLSFKKRNNLK